MKNNIASIRKAKGISQVELADRLGMHWTNLSKIERDKSDPAMDRFQQIADELGVDLAELFALASDADEIADPGFLPYAGKTQAGVFIDVNIYANNGPQYAAISPDPRYRKAKQYVWQVLGDSMNKAGISDGMYAVGVDFVDFVRHYRMIESGDIVVVERLRFDGQERERTIKRYWQEANGAALLPESTNPHHKPIFIPKDGEVEGEEVKIIAYVTGAYNLFGKAIFDLDEGQKIRL